MKLSLLLTTISFISASVGAPLERPRQSDGSLDHFVFPVWPITNFVGGCVPMGCTMLFNMSNAQTATEPGVGAQCNINGAHLLWQECTALPGSSEGRNGSVWALPLPSVEPYGISIQHRFVDYSLSPFRYYNVTGNLTVDIEETRLPVNFTVYALSVTETWSWKL